MVLHSLDHTVEANLSRIRDEAQHRIFYIAFHLVEDFRDESTAQFYALVVNVFIVSAREVYAFEGTGIVGQRLLNLLDAHIPSLFHHNRSTWRQLLYGIRRQVHGGLDHRTLRSNHDDLIIVVIEGRANSRGIAQHEGIAVTHHSGHGISAVPFFGGATQNIRHV